VEWRGKLHVEAPSEGDSPHAAVRGGKGYRGNIERPGWATAGCTDPACLLKVISRSSILPRFDGGAVSGSFRYRVRHQKTSITTAATVGALHHCCNLTTLDLGNSILPVRDRLRSIRTEHAREDVDLVRSAISSRVSNYRDLAARSTSRCWPKWVVEGSVRKREATEEENQAKDGRRLWRVEFRRGREE